MTSILHGNIALHRVLMVFSDLTVRWGTTVKSMHREQSSTKKATSSPAEVRTLPNIDDRTAIELTADIVSAYVGNNPLPAAGLPDLIASVSASVRKLSGVAAKESPSLTPAVNPKRSVFPDYIICLEDGKKFKSLKRHLSTDHGLTPDEYRAKWGLASDYPMVAPNYSATRSALAKSSGLGRKPAAVSPGKATKRKAKA
jgi:predicted transcriptional regulator